MPKALFTKDDYFRLLRNIIKPSFTPGEPGGGEEEEPPTEPPIEPSLLKAVRLAQESRGPFAPVREPGVPKRYMPYEAPKVIREEVVSPLTFTQAIEETFRKPLREFILRQPGVSPVMEKLEEAAQTPWGKAAEALGLLYLPGRVAPGLGLAKGVGKGVGKGAKGIPKAKVEPSPIDELAFYKQARETALREGNAQDVAFFDKQIARVQAKPPAAEVAPTPAAPAAEALKPPVEAPGWRELDNFLDIARKEGNRISVSPNSSYTHYSSTPTPEIILGTKGKTPAQAIGEAMHELGHVTTIAEGTYFPELTRINEKLAMELDAYKWALENVTKYGVSRQVVIDAIPRKFATRYQKEIEKYLGEIFPAEALKPPVKPAVPPMTPETVAETIWNTLPAYRQAEIAKSVGLTPRNGTVYWKELTSSERDALSGAKAAVPKAEAVAPTEAIKPVISPETAPFIESLQTPEGRQALRLSRLQSEIEDMTNADLIDYVRSHKANLLKPENADVLENFKVALEERGLTGAKLLPSPKPSVEAPSAIPKTEVVPPVKPPVQPPITEKVASLPPEGSASKRVLNRIQMEQPEPGFLSKVRQGYHQFQVSMVDDLYAIKKFTGEATKGGVELAIEENPYLLARLLRGVSGKINTFIENGTFGKKFWKIEKGRAVPNFTGESLENILKEVRNPEAWQDFSAYLVARRAKELAGRNIKTGLTLEDAIAAMGELEAKNKNFPQLADRVYKYQDSLLVYGQEMGLISEELLGNLRLYGNYVPFYRVFNELSAKGFMGKKMANIASPIKRIKGSEREIINPLESIVKNTHVLINAADRNQVGIMMANLVDKNPELATLFERVKTPMAKVAGVTAKELGVEIAGLSDEAAEAVVDIFRPSFFTRGDEVTVLLNGKKAYFKVDPDLRDALLNLDRESLGMIGKFLSLPAKWLRAGATLSPDFMVRNPARDAMTAMVYSNYNFMPGVDFVRGLAGLIGKDADYKLFRLSGAEHSMLVSMDREYLHKTFNEIVQGKKFTDYVKRPLELFQIISELGEKATRLGEFKAGIRSGAIPLEAGRAARNVTLDFAQAGTTARAVNSLIAFFNANIRGWTKMVSSFKEHPVRTSTKVFAGITLPSILLYVANRDDPRWKEIPQWQKDLFWIVMTKETIYRIPKPFELGIIFGSIPERFMEWLDNKDPELLKEVLKNMAEAGSPGFLPTAALPIIENLSNYSFFRGGPVVPTSREKMPPELQYTKWTSEVSKHLGELLKQPPAKIDNLINGWTGGLGRYATDILDGILKKTGISPNIPEPSPTLADRPVVKAFVVRNPYGSSGEAVEGFYDALKKYEQGEKYLKEMMALGEKDKFEEYKAGHPELLFFSDFEKDTFYSASARYLRRVARDLTELRKKQDEIYKATDINPGEKRRLIDEIDILKTEVSRKALGLLTGEGQVLQEGIKDAIKKLGTIIEETPLLSLEKPDIFDTKKLYAEFGNLLEAATKDDLAKLKDIDPLALAFIGARDIKKETNSILNKQISDIQLDLKEGVSFEEYYKAWQGGTAKNEEFDKLSRRQLDLLVSYSKLDKKEQAQFLKDHPELTTNPYQEWLKTHPKENAQLAIWGQAKLLTQEADTEARRLIKELDIPDSALPDLTLPPELSVKGYVQYLEQGEKFGYNSAEVKLLLAKDDKLREFLEREPIDTPVAVLELKVKHRKLFDLMDAYSNRDSPDYLDDKVKDAQGLTARDRAQAKLKADNPQWVDDRRRIEAIEHEADDKTIEAWVEHGKLADEAPGFNAEEKLWLIDHPDVHKWALKQKLLTDDGSKWNEPVLRLDVKWRKEDAEYDALPTTGDARENYLAENEEYRQDRRRREAYQKGLTGDMVEDYVDYYELPVAGYRQERFLMGNPDFAEAVGLRVPGKIPSEQYDVLLEKENKTPEDLLRMKAYKLYVPDEYIEDYASYYSLLAKGKPPGQNLWYEDDWWMMEHPEFYKEVWLGILENERKDYRKVPTREVFALYLQSLTLPKGEARTGFRRQHPDLDAWGKLALGWSPLKPTPTATPTPTSTPKSKPKPAPTPGRRSAWDLLEEQGLLGALTR